MRQDFRRQRSKWISLTPPPPPTSPANEDNSFTTLEFPNFTPFWIQALFENRHKHSRLNLETSTEESLSTFFHHTNFPILSRTEYAHSWDHKWQNNTQAFVRTKRSNPSNEILWLLHCDAVLWQSRYQVFHGKREPLVLQIRKRKVSKLESGCARLYFRRPLNLGGDRTWDLALKAKVLRCHHRRVQREGGGVAPSVGS